VITVALPTYNNSDIIWLQLESLCRQVNAPQWELIVCEEESEQYFGFDELSKWKPQLKKANCVEIKYISLSKWIPLGEKWIIIRDNMAEDSVGMLLCASDNYSPPTRIYNAYKALTSGYEWHQTISGYFYNILEHKAGKFDIKELKIPALFMAISRSALSRINKTDYPKRGVDTWMYNSSMPSPVSSIVFEPNGVHTDGFNTISHNRKNLYDANGLFTKADADEVFKIFPKEIQTKIKQLCELKLKS
jgi:hypothetical protein